MSQGVGKLEEIKRDGGILGQQSSHNTHTYQIHCCLWSLFMAPQIDDNTDIKDDQSQMTIKNVIIIM